MKQQRYSNHVRFYPPHHFIFYPLLIVTIGLVAYAFNRYPGHRYLWTAIIACLFFIGFLSFMVRQHYALTLQNRLVRLEMRVRYYQVTGKRFDELESILSFGQVAALRFASDGELENLTTRAVAEKLSPVDIKKAIQVWAPDHMRV